MSADEPDNQTGAAPVQHLRRTMDAVADRAAASDGWASVEERVRSGDPAPLPAAQPARRKMLLVAAVLVLVVAVAAALVAVDGSGNDDQVRTTAPEAPPATTTSTAPERQQVEVGADQITGTLPDGTRWAVWDTPRHGLCATLADVYLGCEDVGGTPYPDPTTARFGASKYRWVAYAHLPPGATGVVVTPLGDAPAPGEVSINTETGIWGVGGANPDDTAEINERYRVQYRTADGTLIDAPPPPEPPGHQSGN